MPKINIKVSISDNTNNDSYEIKSIIQDEIIKYKENDNLRMEYVFNKENETEGTIFIKELNNNIKILINTNKLNRINNNIDIEYVIEDNIFNYRIEEIK